MSEANYADINNERVYPALTREQAGRIARALVSKFNSTRDAAMRPSWDGRPVPARRSELSRLLQRWTSGHPSRARRARVSRTPTTGHFKGMGRLIHDVSHMVMCYRHPGMRPHDPMHAQIEREVQLAVERDVLGTF